MFSIDSPARKSNCLLALSCGLLFAMGAGAASADQPFAFGDRAMDYMDNAAIKTAARALIAAQLPAGLPEARAAARLTHAGMNCKRAPASNRLICSYWRSLTEEWVIRVKLDHVGGVRTARVLHEHIGVDPNS